LQLSTEVIKKLREQTGAGIMDCKRALLEAGGDIPKALEILEQRGLAIARKKAQRVAEQGIVEAYVHMGGRIGVLVEVNCETDFVAHTDEFKELAHNIALQIAAMSPQFVSQDDMPEEVDGEPEVLCLLSQPFIKDPNKTIKNLIDETIAKVGENIKVRRFARFEVGS
jgi:elongation factor Ts